MKRLFTLALGAILAAAIAAPATAGVQGTGGGSTTTNTTRTSTFTDRTVSTNTQYLAPVIRDQGNRIVSHSSNAVTTHTQVTGVNGRSYGYDPVGTVESVSTNLTGSSSYTSFLRTSYEQVADNYVNSYYTKVGTTLDYTSSTKNTQQSQDLIVIGDGDALGSQYTARGTRNVQLDIVDHFWNDMNRTDVRQKVFNKFNDYNQHTTYYYTRHVVQVTYISPLVLNMDGTGKLMASNGNHLAHNEFLENRLAIFDFFGSGEPLLMEWVGPNDGLLCVPKADGRVDGTCLFGIANGYDDGYEELAVTRDRNRDGKVSGAELEGLYVWQDKNGNAIAGTAELKTVQELGITEINCKHDNFKSTFTMNGATQTSWDWWPSVRGLKRMMPKQG